MSSTPEPSPVSEMGRVLCILWRHAQWHVCLRTILPPVCPVHEGSRRQLINLYDSAVFAWQAWRCVAHAESIAQDKLAEQRAQEGVGVLGLEPRHKGDAPASSAHNRASVSMQ